MAHLRVLSGGQKGLTHTLNQEATVLGRHPACDIVLEIGAVSRQHAIILHRKDGFYIEDLNSRNGTYLNERLVDSRQRLTDQDHVRICDLVFMFRDEERPARDYHHLGATGVKLLFEDSSVPAASSSVTAQRLFRPSDSALFGSQSGLTVGADVRLGAFVEIARSLGSALGLEQVLEKLLDSLFTIFPPADRGFVLLRDEKSGEMQPAAVKFRREDVSGTVRVSRAIVQEAVRRKEAILSADAADDSRFMRSESIVDFQIHSIMCVPLVSSDDDVMGVIQIDSRDQGHRFQTEDLELLAGIAGQAGVAVENAQLHEVAVRESLFARELEVAHRVQQGFLPEAPPEIAGYAFYDYYEPARQLGGDYFDYIPLRDSRTAVVVADVSGKGISAALLMAKLSAETRLHLAVSPTASEAVARLNDVFCRSRWEGRFVTFVAVILDPDSHETVIVNAGHPAPLLRSEDGSVHRVGEDRVGFPLGVVSGQGYWATVLSLQPRESLLLCSDGIPDAISEKDEFYGHKRLIERFGALDVKDPIALGEHIINDVRKFVGTHPQSDDMCLTCFGRLS